MSSLDAEIAASAPRASGALARVRWRAIALLGAVFVGYATTVVVRPLVAVDEYRYAEVAREMLASGDWVVPRLDGLLYFEKPPLGYWLTALSIGAFGANAAAVRLPFAVSTLLAAAIVFALVRRYGSGARAAGIAALGFLTCVEVSVVGTTAVLDPLFALAVTATLAALFAASEAAPGGARQRWLAASGVACGAAFLTKGFLAFAIPISVAVPYLVWSRRSRDLLRLPWTPLAVALAISAPWSIAVARAQPDFWHQFVVNEHLRRFAGESPQHPEPFWYFLPVLVVGALPWTSLVVPALRRRAALASPLARFSVCWLVAPALLLSAASGKLMTYVLPCFAPLFVLIAEGAVPQPRAQLSRHLAWIAAAVAALGVVVAVALALPLPAIGVLFDAGEHGKRALGAIGSLAVAAIAAGALRRSGPEPRAAAIAAAFSIGLAVAAIAFPTGKIAKTPERWLARLGPIPANAIVVADHNLVHAVAWQLGRADVNVLGGAGELAYGFARVQNARLLDSARLAALIRDPARTRPVVVIGRSARTSLPPGIRPDRSDTSLDAFFGVYDPPGGHS